MAAGRLRWEDLENCWHPTPVYLADVVNKSVGVTGAPLNRWYEDGEISAADPINALLEAGARIDEEFEMMPDNFCGSG